MNYLTNYYKNLSEQLQKQINLLESYIHGLNEDLVPGTIVQGYGSSNSSTATNQNQNPELNSFLQAWGSSDPTYDYNRDGVVDGNDLGIFLSRSLDTSRPSSPVRMASTALQGTPGLETPSTPAGGSKQMRALDQPGTEKTPFPGTYNAGSGSRTPRNITGKSTQKKGSGANLGQETVAGTPSAPRPKSPTQVGYGDEVTNVLRNKIETPSNIINARTFTTKAGTGDGDENPPSPPPPPIPGDFNGDGFVNSDDLGQLLANWGQGGVGDMNGDGVIDADDLGLFLNAFTSPSPPPPPPDDMSGEESIPYWMSGRTTDVNVGFRSKAGSKERRKSKSR